MQVQKSFETLLKKFPKQKPGFADIKNSYHELCIADDRSLSKLKKDKAIPVKLWEGFELSDKEPAKAIHIPHGIDQNYSLLVYKNGIDVFFIHEAIRKNFNFDGTKTSQLWLDLNHLDSKQSIKIIEAIANYLELLAYKNPVYGKKAKSSSKKQPLVEVYIHAKLKQEIVQSHYQLGQKQAQATNLVRYLAEMPGNELRPSNYLTIIKELSKKWGAQVSFLNQTDLKKKNANAFLAVVRSNPSEPYGIVHLKYKPKTKASSQKIALVGKGLCFDTGGYNIKTGHYMFDMHRDMTGSAVALATFGLLCETSTKHEVHAFLALAENLISPSAYRPNDVVVASNGLSIEVVDTDAEGRMALSDTLVIANETSPDLIIDFATLTGAAVRAIDTRRSAVFSNRESLLKTAQLAGDETGERVWGFPIGGDYWEQLSSEVADLRQCASGNNSDHIYAATFLSAFVKPETPWLHVDLVCESNKGGLGLCTKEVNGFGVRLAQKIIDTFKPEKPSKKAKK